MTRIRQRNFTPWLLGWCRWEITLEHTPSPAITMSDVLASGSWRWRRRGDRHYREYVYEVAGVGEINAKNEKEGERLSRLQ